MDHGQPRGSLAAEVEEAGEEEEEEAIRAGEEEAVLRIAVRMAHLLLQRATVQLTRGVPARGEEGQPQGVATLKRSGFGLKPMLSTSARYILVF